MEQLNEANTQSQTGKRLADTPPKNRKKVRRALLAALCAAAVLYLGVCALAAATDTIYPNRTMRDIPVGGLTAGQAETVLAEGFPQQTFTVEVCLTDPDTEVLQTLTVPYGDLGASLNYDLAARVAAKEWPLNSRNFFADGWDYLLSLLGRSDKASFISLDIDAAAFESGWNALLSQITAEAQDASYSLENKTLTVTTAKDGLRLSTDPEQNDQIAAFRTCLMTAQSGTIHLEVDPAQTLTAKSIYVNLHGTMQNASYDSATETILPERLGVDFDVTAAQKLLDAAAPGETVTLNAVIEEPEVTAAELEEVLFRDVLGEAKTKVGGTASRKNNVKLSAASINGYVMNSGDVFSYNDVVGQRTAANGYQAAPAYVKGETVDEIGGGICQTSSTLYLACLRGNLEITERYAHRYIPAYIAAGMDATVSWGGPDYKFTNDTLYPIKIVTEYENGYLTVKLLGTNVTGITAKMTNEKLSSTEFEIVYEESAEQAPGTQSVKTTPYTGSKWRTYRHLYDADGKLISSAYEATSDYKARNKVILVAPGELPGAEPAAPAELPTTDTGETTSAASEEPPQTVVTIPAL